MNRNFDAAPLAIAGRSSWSRLSTTTTAGSLRQGWFRYFRIERVAESVLGPLHFEDVAAVAIAVAPPTARHELVAARHCLVQHLGDVDTCSCLPATRYFCLPYAGGCENVSSEAREGYRFRRCCQNLHSKGRFPLLVESRSDYGKNIIFLFRMI